MFDDWKQAWRQAVENFQREAGIEGAPPRVKAMERELTSAGGALLKLDEEIIRTRRELAKERDSEQVSRRRGSMAADVGDTETARIAEEFAARHTERAAVLDRKLAVLQDERALLARDVDTMRRTLSEAAAAATTIGASSSAPDDVLRDEPRDVEFSRMERERRERAAAERLEELKRKMRG